MNPIHKTGYIIYPKFVLNGFTYHCRETKTGKSYRVRDAIDTWYRFKDNKLLERIKLTRGEAYLKFKNVKPVAEM